MYDINAKYSNSRIVNYNRWSEAAEVKGLADVLVSGMKTDLRINKPKGYMFNMITLMMELYHSHLTDKDQYIAYYRTKEHYDFRPKLGADTKGRRYYKNPHITHTCFTGCIDYLADKGYIENSTGGQFRDEEGGAYGYLSRMRATLMLVTLWGEYKITPDMITKFNQDEVIILKGKKKIVEYIFRGRKVKKTLKPVVDYQDNRETRRIRKVVEDYNRLLERTHIDTDVECMSQSDKDAILGRLLDAKDKFKYSINLGAKQVYRVFNNGSFKEGGRFYGAWWIGCPSILRKYITINGELTTELDYSGIHINLLYALKGLNFADYNTDAYELIDNDPDRELNKLILLTAYNASSPQETAKAVFKETRDDGTKNYYKLKKHKQVYDKLEQLKIKHEPIKGYIAENFGSILQYHDAGVLEQLIIHFTRMKIPILTVHDSIICQRKYHDMVKDKMLQLYSSYVNDVFDCTTRYQSSNPHAKYVLQMLTKDIKITQQQRDISNKNMFDKYKFTGRLPTINNSTIKVKEETATTRCTNKCEHSIRIKNRLTGKRIYLVKIIIQYTVVDSVINLIVSQ